MGELLWGLGGLIGVEGLVAFGDPFKVFLEFCNGGKWEGSGSRVEVKGEGR